MHPNRGCLPAVQEAAQSPRSGREHGGIETWNNWCWSQAWNRNSDELENIPASNTASCSPHELILEWPGRRQRWREWEPDTHTHTHTRFGTKKLLSAVPHCTQNTMCQTHLQFPVTAVMPPSAHVRVTHTDVLTLRQPALSQKGKTVMGNYDLARREGIQAWAQERLLHNAVLWWFAFTFESLIRADNDARGSTIAEAAVPNTRWTKVPVSVTQTYLPPTQEQQ